MLNGRVSVLHSLVTRSISSGEEKRIYYRWDLIRSNHLSNVTHIGFQGRCFAPVTDKYFTCWWEVIYAISRNRCLIKTFSISNCISFATRNLLLDCDRSCFSVIPVSIFFFSSFFFVPAVKLKKILLFLNLFVFSFLCFVISAVK